MEPDGASDQELMQALLHRAVSALEQLYDRHHRMALAIAYRVLGDSSLAEDAVQESFLAVWRRPDQFNADRGSFRSWLLGIVRHRAIDIARGRSAGREQLSLDQIAVEPTFHDAWQEVNLRLDAEIVRRAIQALPEGQRDAIMLAYYGGYTQQEVSEQTGLPLGTVKGRMRLGMQKLRSMLMPLAEGDSH